MAEEVMRSKGVTGDVVHIHQASTSFLQEAGLL